MESRNIEKALEISAKLAAGETVSEQGTNAALYQEYSYAPAFAVSSILVVIAIIILVVRAVIEYKGDKRGDI